MVGIIPVFFYTRVAHLYTYDTIFKRDATYVRLLATVERADGWRLVHREIELMREVRTSV